MILAHESSRSCTKRAISTLKTLKNTNFNRKLRMVEGRSQEYSSDRWVDGGVEKRFRG